MTAPKHGGWHRPTRSTIGQHDTIAIIPKPAPPKTSWWTRPVQSHAEFDRLVRDRWLGVTQREIEARV